MADSPDDRKQKAATAFLRDAIQKRNFAIPIAARASKAFGPISRHLTAQILPQMCNASRASRPGLAVGILRVLCNGMCTAQRFDMEGEEQRCRAGCQDEPDSLSHTTMNALSSTDFFTAVWKACCSSASERPSSSRPHYPDLLRWVSLMPSCTLTTTTVEMWIIQGTLEIVWKEESGL